MASREDISAWIRRLRLQLGLTQGQLGESLGVTLVTVSRWETGQVRPNKLAMKALTALESSFSGHTYSTITPGTSSIAEPQTSYGNRPPLSLPDFRAESESVRLFVEGERLSYGHLFSSSFGIETAIIDPVPHQIIAVYNHMLPQPRLRFLLADDPGAGKTIMTGLYIREMLNRRLIKRILIVPPAGLVGNWLNEMRTLFSLHFHEVTGPECHGDNPFAGTNSDLAIVSVDTLAGGNAFERLASPDTLPYELVVFDEAHKLSASRNPDLTYDTTDRYKLAELIAGATPLQESRPPRTLPWHAHHLILLTATPHMGKDFPYYALWRLLEPNLFSTIDAFNRFPSEAKASYFIRRAKEEMVRFDNSRIYPTRESNTVSYELSDDEKELYDETTSYISTYYNRAQTLNRSAARLAMSVLQRRAASSTWALLRSLERRVERLDGYITKIIAKELDEQELQYRQEKLPVKNIEDKTAEEEVAQEGQEQRDVSDDEIMGATPARNLAELQAERMQLLQVLYLARKVYDKGGDSKFRKLCATIQDERFKGQKFLIFTEHRDTMDFLVQSFEGLGYTGEIAHIHGGMPYQERENQVKDFRDHCRFMVATDAAGEGINLQFCWIMINYDIPWNPARIEQRFGRIHRYKQTHDPVVLVNLTAEQTRDGRVLKTLLDKLERIRKELGSDKVFDIIGRQFQGVSLSDIIMRAVAENRADEASQQVEGILTMEQARAIAEADDQLRTGGDVVSQLPAIIAQRERDQFNRLLPGYVRRFLEKTAPRLGIRVNGPLERHFYLEHLPLLLTLALDEATENERVPFTINKPENEEKVIFLRPGELFFDRYAAYFCDATSRDALKGATFIDPYATGPYFYHLALVSIVRRKDTDFTDGFGTEQVLQMRLVAVAQSLSGEPRELPVEALMLLRSADFVSPAVLPSNEQILRSMSQTRNYLSDTVASDLARREVDQLVAMIPEWEKFLLEGFAYQEAELSASRIKLRDKTRMGDSAAVRELEAVRKKQQDIAARREQALAILRREPELVSTGGIVFLAHALVLPSTNPVDRERYDEEIERLAMQVARVYEESLGAKVHNVSTPEQALGAGLDRSPGFDLLAYRSSGEKRCIEVKGRRAVGDIELTENEWAKAANLRQDYWLYVVYDCATSHPHLHRVHDPFKSLLFRAKGGVIIDENSIFAAAEEEA